jgi:hypothetical protein
MKAPQEQFNPDQEAELTYFPEWNNGQPFVIRDIGESLLPLATAIQAAEAAPAPRTNKVTSMAGKAAVEAPEVPETLTGRRATITAKLYDLVNGSSMYDLLMQKRRDERDLAMAKKLGLITTDRCAKHEKAVSKLRGLTLN